MDIPFSIACVMHGEMKHRFDKDWWVCVGFDGEECSSFFTTEALFAVMHGGPIQDERCLPAQWFHNHLTGIVEIVIGGKGCQEASVRR